MVGMLTSLTQIDELRKYYAGVPGVCDLVEKCLQVCASNCTLTPVKHKQFMYYFEVCQVTRQQA